jgi:hypothetical protein
MIVNNSQDISSIDFGIIWDISGVLPQIQLENLSTGSGLANTLTWFVVTSPTNTPIHEGSSLSPDFTGVWSSATENWSWPRPFNNIEFSGNTYSATMYMQDSEGNVYHVEKSVSICRPYGNTPTSKNTYGLADAEVIVKCDQARVFFQDVTINSYKGLTGTQLSSALKVIYPIDETGNIPDPFSINNFSTALVPISYSSDNYQFLINSVYDYDFGDNVSVRIRYQALRTFAVWCNIDLMPLVCEYTKLIQSIEDGSCGDVQSANRKLMLINPKFSMVMIGIMQPMTGVDVPKLIREIVEIGGFPESCCNAPSGIIPTTSSVVDGYSFSIVSGCGDISGIVETTGTNIQFTLSDVTYVFAMYPDSPQDISAFSIVPATSGCTKTYYLRVDGTQLAYDLLNIIKYNAGLVNLFNSIVVSGGSGSGQLIVDGQCIFQSTSTCNYTFGLSNIPVNTTYALLTGIKIGSINYPLGFSFNLTNLGALQTYLNGLGYGTFTVTNPSGQNVQIVSNANGNDIQRLTYSISSTNYNATLSSDCTGYVPLDSNQVVQNIIDYLCGINDSQIITSQNYSVCYVNIAGTVLTEIVPAGTSLADFLTEITTKGCQTIQYIQNLSALTCAAVKEVFVSNNLQITGTDRMYGTKGGGVCSELSYIDAFNYMLTAGISNATTKDLFCQFVSSCGAGNTCGAFSFLEPIVTLYDSSCVNIVGIEISLS